MDKSEFLKLESTLQSLKTAHAALGEPDDWDELWRIVHQPGWTTLAEATLVHITIESIVAQTRQLTALRSGLIAGARLVGKSQAVAV
jgi:hypothetical protein